MNEPEAKRSNVRHYVIDHYINHFNRDNVTITRYDDATDASGVNFRYAIFLGDQTKCPPPDVVLKFQKGHLQDVGVNGITDEALLAIVVDRLRGFQRGSASCRENAIVITKLEESLMWLRARAEDRERRGVEGTSQK